MKKFLIIAGILIVLAVAGIILVPRFLASRTQQTTSTYQTQPAEIGSLTAYVGATGTVRSNQSAVIAWQTNGTVDTLTLKKGDLVKANEVLAQLLPSSVSQNIILAESDLITAQNALKTAMNNSEARAAAALTLAEAQKAVDDAQKESQSKLYQRAGANTIDIARANYILAEQKASDAQDAYDHVAGRATDDAIYAAALSQLANARQERDRAHYNLLYVQGLPDPNDIATAKAKLDQAVAKLQTAKTDWEKVKDGPNPDDIKAAQARVQAAQATLNTTHLTAPFSATITQVFVNNGDLVNAGTKAFQIDDLTRLLVDVQVSEVDINRVQEGQPVTLTFDAVPNKEYNGDVTDIASVGNTTSGSVNFVVTVEITDFDEEVKPGMTAAVNIAVTQLDNVLTIPNQAVRVVNGKRVVYVLKNGLPTSIEITLGASSNTSSEVTGGDLKSGDEIILNPPSNLFQRPGGAQTGPGGGG
jgi:HlyD family secretion protein